MSCNSAFDVVGMASRLVGTNFAPVYLCMLICLASALCLTKSTSCRWDLAEEPPPSGMEALTQELVKRVLTKPRRPDGAFLFAVDHCFPIKGQGTVLTGTVLQGSVAVNQASGRTCRDPIPYQAYRLYSDTSSPS